MAPVHGAAGICCAACGGPAGDPEADAVVAARVANWLGAHIYLCGGCVEADLQADGG
jgi:hypothetical protein